MIEPMSDTDLRCTAMSMAMRHMRTNRYPDTAENLVKAAKEIYNFLSPPGVHNPSPKEW